MEDRVIAPSEIIVEQKSAPRQEIARANPWIRFLARFFDYSLFFLLLWGLRNWLGGQFPFARYEHLIPYEFFVWIPFEALLLSTWGTTPGKFLLRTQLKAKKKFDFTTALRRSFSVWFRGLGMGIPILNVFCLLIAYQKLKVFKITSWDRDDGIAVTHLPISRIRLVFAAVVAIFGLLFYYSDKNEVLNKPTSTKSFS